MEYISARKTADKWGISQHNVSMMCLQNKIPNAKMIGNMWIIPANAQKPTDTINTRYNITNDEKPRPFLKWAGGKGQLLSEIRKRYPFENKNIKKYAEPFVGGGAVLFDILSKYDMEAVYISDINAELINSYITLRDNVDELTELLYKLQRVEMVCEDYYEKGKQK